MILLGRECSSMYQWRNVIKYAFLDNCKNLDDQPNDNRMFIDPFREAFETVCPGLISQQLDLMQLMQCQHLFPLGLIALLQWCTTSGPRATYRPRTGPILAPHPPE